MDFLKAGRKAKRQGNREAGRKERRKKTDLISPYIWTPKGSTHSFIWVANIVVTRDSFNERTTAFREVPSLDTSTLVIKPCLVSGLSVLYLVFSYFL